MARTRKIPQRTCIVCRSAQDKRRLIRIVRTREGQVEVDPSGKKPGRGAYVCESADCFGKGLRGSVLENALKIKMSEEQLLKLKQDLQERLGSMNADV